MKAIARRAIAARGPHPLAAWLQLATREQSDPDRLALLLEAVRRYQAHPHRRRSRTMPVVAQVGSAKLLDYGGDGPPLLCVPSLVNPSWILDFEPRRSLVRTLRAAGFRALLLDWGEPDEHERGFSLDDYVVLRLQPLVAALGGPVTLVGYCLGGTLTLALAALAPALVERLVLLAAPFHFDGYPEPRRAELAQFWRDHGPAAAALGALPMEILQLAFWSLDTDALAAKFLRFAAMAPDSLAARRFVMMEDWANSGPPLSAPSARQCFEAFFAENQPGAGGWRIGATLVDPASVVARALVVASRADRLVPHAAAAPVARRMPAATLLDLSVGHVGMVAGSQARRQLFNPLVAWLRACS